MSLSREEKKFIAAIVGVAAAGGVAYFGYQAYKKNQATSAAALSTGQTPSTTSPQLESGQQHAYQPSPSHGHHGSTPVQHDQPTPAAPPSGHQAPRGAAAHNASYERMHSLAAVRQQLGSLGYTTANHYDLSTADGFASAVFAFQGAYNRDHVARGISGPSLRVDGQIGRKTIEALNAWSGAATHHTAAESSGRTHALEEIVHFNDSLSQANKDLARRVLDRYGYHVQDGTEFSDRVTLVNAVKTFQLAYGAEAQTRQWHPNHLTSNGKLDANTLAGMRHMDTPLVAPPHARPTAAEQLVQDYTV